MAPRLDLVFMSGSTSTQRQAVRANSTGSISTGQNHRTAVYNSKSEWRPDRNREDHEPARVKQNAVAKTRGVSTLRTQA